jgi:hypothetical protein
VFASSEPFVESDGTMSLSGSLVFHHWIYWFVCLVLCAQTVLGQNTSNATISNLSTPRQRFGHSAVLLPNRTMLIFGGHNYQYTNVQKKLYVGLKNDLWFFDLGASVYSPVVPVLNTSAPPPRMHHSAVLLTDPNGTACFRSCFLFLFSFSVLLYYFFYFFIINFCCFSFFLSLSFYFPLACWLLY